MPELPEVETIRRDLRRVILGKRIVKVEVKKAKMVRGSIKRFSSRLKGCKVTDIRRRGKLLILRTDKGADKSSLFLLIHLMMTGQLIWKKSGRIVAGGHGWPMVDKLPNKYSHVIISFQDGSSLYFNDMRQFGYMELANRRRTDEVLSKYGLEPLENGFTWQALQAILKRRKTALKKVLLDQREVAGLGNIYVDEACFLSGIRPTKKSNRVTKRELVKLHRAIGRVLRKAIEKRGTTFSSYRDGRGGEGDFVRLLYVYGRAGERCKKCRAAELKKTKVGGRGTVYCPKCQV